MRRIEDDDENHRREEQQGTIPLLESTTKTTIQPIIVINDDDEESNDHHSNRESVNSYHSSQTPKDESIIEIPMGGGGYSLRERSRTRNSLTLSSVFPSLKGTEQQHQRRQPNDYFSLSEHMVNSDGLGPILNLEKNGSASNRDTSIISNVSWEGDGSESTAFDESLVLEYLYNSSTNNGTYSPYYTKRATTHQTSCLTVLDVFDSNEKQHMDSLRETGRGKSNKQYESKRRKTVSFADDASFPEWVLRDHPNKKLSRVLDIYNRSVDDPFLTDDHDIKYNNYTRNEFERKMYDDDNDDETSCSECDLDDDEENENTENNVIRGVLYQVGVMALMGAIRGASKLFSAFRKSEDNNQTGEVAQVTFQDLFGKGEENLVQASEVMEEAMHASELAMSSAEVQSACASLTSISSITSTPVASASVSASTLASSSVIANAVSVVVPVSAVTTLSTATTTAAAQ
jgi:hypothetical protein